MDRFKIKNGAYGDYFYDIFNKKDMTLKEVLGYLNNFIFNEIPKEVEDEMMFGDGSIDMVEYGYNYVIFEKEVSKQDTFKLSYYQPGAFKQEKDIDIIWHPKGSRHLTGVNLKIKKPKKIRIKMVVCK